MRLNEVCGYQNLVYIFSGLRELLKVLSEYFRHFRLGWCGHLLWQCHPLWDRRNLGTLFQRFEQVLKFVDIFTNKGFGSFNLDLTSADVDTDSRCLLFHRYSSLFSLLSQ